jgi:hypothetical protein
MVHFDMEEWDGSFSALPSLSELGVHPGTLEVAEEIVSSFDEPSVSTHVLEWLIAAIVLLERARARRDALKIEPCNACAHGGKNAAYI